MILVVDDEDGIRDVIAETLREQGYRVLTAADGVEAIALHSQHRHDIKVVLTDLMMPSMDGLTMTRILKRLDPAIKIIASTGMGSVRGLQDKTTELSELGVKIMLAKPYRALEILTALTTLL
ncbi:MAG: response regulator, partial [Prosthecobacter sp.]|nr:response regulator [Prosthecobacter sp.]